MPRKCGTGYIHVRLSPKNGEKIKAIIKESDRSISQEVNRAVKLYRPNGKYKYGA